MNREKERKKKQRKTETKKDRNKQRKKEKKKERKKERKKKERRKKKGIVNTHPKGQMLTDFYYVLFHLQKASYIYKTKTLENYNPVCLGRRCHNVWGTPNDKP